MVRRCVRSRNLVNEEALAHWGAVALKTNKGKIEQIEYEDKEEEEEEEEDVNSYWLTLSKQEDNGN